MPPGLPERKRERLLAVYTLIRLFYGGKALKVTTARLPDCKAKLTVEIGPEQVEESLRQVARRVARQVRIPGFRPGRAPFSVIERRFGRETLLERVIEEQGQNWYEQALEDVELKPFGQAELEVTSNDPLVITFTLPVAPKVELGEYRDIRLEWEPPIVTDEEVERELARLQQESSLLEPRDRPAELENVATMDVQGRIGDELVVDLSEQAIALSPHLNYPVAGFAQEIVGMSAGQDREFTLTYPPDHPNTAWAGKQVHLTAHMHDLKVWVTPELDDELAMTIGHETVDEWRASVREELLAKALEQAEQDYADNVIDALIEQTHIEFPVLMVEQQLDSMLQERDQLLKQRGLGLENYLVMSGQSREEYRESLREAAEDRIRRGLVLTELIEAEALQVTDADVDGDIDRLAETMGDEAENFRQLFANEGMRASVRNNLLTQAAVDMLKTIARGEGVSQPSSEPGEGKESTPEAEAAEAAQKIMEETATVTDIADVTNATDVTDESPSEEAGAAEARSNLEE